MIGWLGDGVTNPKAEGRPDGIELRPTKQWSGLRDGSGGAGAGGEGLGVMLET